MSAKVLTFILSAAIASGGGAMVTEVIAGAPEAAAAQLVGAVANRRMPNEAGQDGDDRLVMRICLGPANVTFGGESPVAVAFRAGGCGERLFGLAFISTHTQRPTLVI